MIYRFDQITVDLPAPNGPDANAAAAVQELLGGKFGEMSTLMNYTFQSFNFRGKKNFRPFYDLISNIAAEEYSHIEAVTATINLLLKGTTPRTDRNEGAKTGGNVDDPAAKHKDAKTNPAPLKEACNFRNTVPFPQQRPAGAADGFHGPLLDRRERLLQRQPEARPAAQLLPGMRRARREDRAPTSPRTTPAPAR